MIIFHSSLYSTVLYQSLAINTNDNDNNNKNNNNNGALIRNRPKALYKKNYMKTRDKLTVKSK